MSVTPPFVASGRVLLLGTVLLSMPAAGQSPLPEAALEAQSQQAALQERIDAADESTREQLRELRRLERETRRLTAQNEERAPRLERRAENLERREAALDTLEDTREALPALKRSLVARLDAWVEGDLPFLREERRARVASLEASLSDPDLSEADQLDRILGAWRAELDYGREFDAWRGYLGGEGDEEASRREVDFLRLARVGLYYLTPDGREGGVWQAEEGRWASLDEAARREVRTGLRIARDQRAPELLTLPLSQPLESHDDEEGRS
ncbi:DUF3450 domain-containing protein [Billgrantia gudaonensis]|uniref:DUF3450 domain-containing protein n=1 Tax=Billgrantia gudaonensis TaxID=376427 RepID=A0A1G8NCW4_9GAMM|nr:DUF3450 domain-containing protein [Halomonas gudaonensis]SDI78094.1 Protein of unknown function [Halomonas gudaonensis]